MDLEWETRSWRKSPREFARENSAAKGEEVGKRIGKSLRGLLLILCWIAVNAPIAGVCASVPVWEKSGEGDGITIFKRDMPNSDLLAFKGEGDVDAPIERVATVIFDTQRSPEWVVDLEKSTIVRWISKTEFIEYDHFRTPPIIMKDRDFVSRVAMKIDPKSRQMQFHYQATEEPALPEKDKIRGNLMNTTFVLTPNSGNTRTHVSGEIHCDPKGSVAKWLVNFYQQGWPMDTLKGLRKQVSKKDIAVDPKILELFKYHP